MLSKFNPFMHNVVKWLNMFGHFTILCVKGLRELLSNLLDIRSKIWRRFIIQVLPI